MKSFIVKLANLIGETGIYSLLCPNRMPVFMLHRITAGPTALAGALPADTLRRYLAYLAKRRYRVLTMAELVTIVDQEQRIPDRSVMFTIDDGFMDHFDLAGKIFDEFGFPLNFFVITDLLDRKLWPWDDQINYAVAHTARASADVFLPSGQVHRVDLVNRTQREAARELRDRLKREDQHNLYDWLRNQLYPSLGVAFPADIPPEYSPMTWDHARSLRARGHGVYPHTCSHRILSTLSLADKHTEIGHSLERVQAELAYRPEVFAYPTGRRSDYDMSDVAELKKSGVRIAFNTVPGYVRQGQNPYELSRFSLPGRLSEFLQIVNRFEALNGMIHRQGDIRANFLPIR